MKINIIRIARLLGSFIMFRQKQKQKEREELLKSVNRFKKEQENK